jgi:hypothetical protein
MASPTPHLTFRDVLKIRAVRRLWLAQLVSIFGDFLAIFAVFSLVTFQLHGTPTQVSMILVAYMPVVPGMLHQSPARLNQPLLQTRQRPVLDLLR